MVLEKKTTKKGLHAILVKEKEYAKTLYSQKKSKNAIHAKDSVP
jgi:hypothetical protein